MNFTLKEPPTLISKSFFDILYFILPTLLRKIIKKPSSQKLYPRFKFFFSSWLLLFDPYLHISFEILKTFLKFVTKLERLEWKHYPTVSNTNNYQLKHNFDIISFQLFSWLFLIGLQKFSWKFSLLTFQCRIPYRFVKQSRKKYLILINLWKSRKHGKQI